MMAAIRPFLRTFWVGAALLLAPGIGAQTVIAQDYNFPKLTGRVVDEANILDASTRADFERRLADLEAKTTSQFVVVTLSSLRGRTIEEYGYQLGRHWGIGQRGSNNGVMLIVAPNERKVRIEVGYGLEGTFPDAISSIIVQNSILPRFRANDYPGGIKRGVDDIIKVLSGNPDEFKRPGTAEKSGAKSAFGTFLSVLFAFLFSTPGLIFLLFFMHYFFLAFVKIGIWLGLIPPKASRKKSNWGWVDSTGYGSSSGSGWSSSGSGGGGFSGGGGSFGGGGSSGSW